jgi:hypothetical protein
MKKVIHVGPNGAIGEGFYMMDEIWYDEATKRGISMDNVLEILKNHAVRITSEEAKKVSEE